MVDSRCGAALGAGRLAAADRAGCDRRPDRYLLEPWLSAFLEWLI
jgi:hypothetical protein